MTTVDEGIELLTGVSAGVREADGDFSGDSINRLVEERLIHFSMQLKRFARSDKDENGGKGNDD